MNMLNIRFSVSVILIGWFCLSASICAQALPFIAPKERPQLEASKPWPTNRFLVLAYHDVEDDAADQRYLSVRTSALNEQISWLLHNGYHAISVQDILDAHDGKNAAAESRFAQF
jgi:biofilm PGA synthesis lipoprotein PgaB